MKLTNSSEYALLALVYLARHQGEGFISVEKVALAQNIPRKFLERILHTMKHPKLVHSAKGQHGGYQLARPPEQINLADVIRLFEGALAPTESVSTYFYESTPIEKEANLLRVFREIRDYVSEKLENTTLADIL